jgi:hypothetical protein
VGPNITTKRNRSNLEFPTNWSDIKGRFDSSLPVLKYKKYPKGKPLPYGKGLMGPPLGSPEESLAALGPSKASLPERMVYGWLIRHKVIFDYQSPVLGGKVAGGAVLDFVLHDRVDPIVIRIQSYWHTGASNMFADAIQLSSLQELKYTVEDVWEWEINTVSRLDNKMRQILYGAPKFTEVA